MAKNDPKDFYLNTDYEMDKIVYFKEGSFTGSTTFNHNLKFSPLIFGVWSTSSDFSTINSIGVTDSSGEHDYTPVLGVGGSSSNTNIQLEASGQGSGSTTIYYRLYAFEPPKSNESTPKTSSHAKEFVFNTDYNYRKLKATGEITTNGGSYEHKLGYIPQVMAWWKATDDLGGRTYPLNNASEFTNFYLEITNDKIGLPAGSQVVSIVVDKIIWRVYYDEA